MQIYQITCQARIALGIKKTAQKAGQFHYLISGGDDFVD
jgi:hypothetical protein